MKNDFIKTSISVCVVMFILFIGFLIVINVEQGIELLTRTELPKNDPDVSLLYSTIENDVMNKSVIDEKGEILSISQFTLYGDTRKGNRPSYIRALGGDKALPMYERFNELLNQEVPTKGGVFGADMKVEILNDGPTTIIIDTENK
jgi:D-tyrosyl-tRNA(Tyr) deacylase